MQAGLSQVRILLPPPAVRLLALRLRVHNGSMNAKIAVPLAAENDELIISSSTTGQVWKWKKGKLTKLDAVEVVLLPSWPRSSVE